MTTPLPPQFDLPALAATVSGIVAAQPVSDLHTHVFSPAFGACPDPSQTDGGINSGGLMLWGIDELVTYHYLVAEVFRVVTAKELPAWSFWSMSKQQQADHIWKHLFVERTPMSEACRGVITTLTRLGLDPHEKTLEPYRQWFAQQSPDAFVDKVMQIANVDLITMTNEVFDETERNLWMHDADRLRTDSRFASVLRIDKMVIDWSNATRSLREMGYDVRPDFSGTTVEEGKRFLNDWIEKMKAVYVATSLPPEFQYPTPAPGRNTSDRVIREMLMPVLAERNMPWAIMIGVTRQVNPSLRGAGDMIGHADISVVTNLARQFSDNRFMVTMLSRENQHELCVAARKFGNVLPFGCWWFLNNPSLIEEITRMRLELLGTTMVPQHSDARIVDQLVYKWDHSRRIIARVLTDKYALLAESGYRVTDDQIRADVANLLRGNYRRFVGL